MHDIILIISDIVLAVTLLIGLVILIKPFICSYEITYLDKKHRLKLNKCYGPWECQYKGLFFWHTYVKNTGDLAKFIMKDRALNYLRFRICLDEANKAFK